MAKLPFAPAHLPFEPPIAYASRIAAAYGLEARELCGDQGVRFPRLVRGDQAAIKRLAKLGGADPDDLLSCAFARQRQFEIVHRGQTFRREDLVLDRLDVCLHLL
ncbi:hypothetical protein [Bradyrhizobium vignae]|uniref:Uncharacterized protein n=1 Tax=Bradyrhizobium vignae TaxID=1549949 RepID=A0A2U3PUN1_9BRAD|nr:hypothetical protein [Bradyrhizobium vignae]SPP92852.1 protein of unknown function [Bradyrhizobium vignae]